MKTTWSEPYVMQMRKPRQWCRAKRSELMAKTGVPWTMDRAHGKVRFAPAFKAQWAGANEDSDEKAALMAVLREQRWPYYIRFLDLTKALSWPLVKLFATLNSLLPKVTFTVNRMGDVVEVKALEE